VACDILSFNNSAARAEAERNIIQPIVYNFGLCATHNWVGGVRMEQSSPINVHPTFSIGAE
jgi:hypothetical protein